MDPGLIAVKMLRALLTEDDAEHREALRGVRLVNLPQILGAVCALARDLFDAAGIERDDVVTWLDGCIWASELTESETPRQ
jgi:hypothetical protein